MTENLDEKMSALVDGELPGEDISPLLEELKQSPMALSRWRHYHLISDAMKNNLPERLAVDLSSRVSCSLEAEPPLSTPIPLRRTSKGHNFFRPAVGFAMAASVAAIAYLGIGWEGQPDIPQAPRIAATTAAVAPVVSYTQVKGRQWTDVEQPAVASRLNDYLINHDHYSALAGMNTGILPQVRIAGYERPANPQDDSSTNR